MQEVIVDGRPIPVRPLTRREVRELRDQGVNLAELSPGQVFEVVETVTDLVLDEEQRAFLDDRGFPESRAIYMAVLKETFGDPEAEKNS